jgi:hypothetical protein
VEAELSDEVRVRLSWAEVLQAASVGAMRKVQCLKEHWTPGAGRNNHDDDWTPNIEGAAGEMAVAKHLGIYWSGSLGNYKADDVGSYQVRTNTSRQWTDMSIRTKDRDDRIYISVLSFLPEFVICGWLAGNDCKRQEWWRDGTPGRPCFWVPRGALQPISALPGSLNELNRHRALAAVGLP